MYLFIIFQCHSVVFVDLNANFIKEKPLKGFNLASFKCTLKYYFDILRFIVLFSFIRCWLCSQQKCFCFLPPKLHKQLPANWLVCSQQHPLVSKWNANNTAELLFD
ncbi:hypothetical protein PAMP_006937 [Pampus punctatissimus]